MHKDLLPQEDVEINDILKEMKVDHSPAWVQQFKDFKSTHSHKRKILITTTKSCNNTKNKIRLHEDKLKDKNDKIKETKMRIKYFRATN